MIFSNIYRLILREIISVFLLFTFIQPVIAQGEKSRNREFEIFYFADTTFSPKDTSVILSDNNYWLYVYGTNDKIFSVGKINSPSDRIYNGIFEKYYSNGRILTSCVYRSGTASGQRKYFFSDGKPWRTYFCDKQDSINHQELLLNSFSSKGDTLVWRGNGVDTIYFRDGSVFGYGPIKDGFKNGTWFWFRNGDTTGREEWDNGYLIHGYSYFSHSMYTSVYTDFLIDNVPFEEVFYRRFWKILPTINGRISGSVKLRLTFYGVGKTLKITLMDRDGIDEETIQKYVDAVSEITVNWTPIYYHGFPVRVVYIIPIVVKVNR